MSLLQDDVAPLRIEKQRRKPKPISKAERRRRRAKAQRKRLDLLAQLHRLPDDACLRFSEWCALNGISERNGRRILGMPGGPAVTWLSNRRIGITVSANRAWQKTRARG